MQKAGQGVFLKRPEEETLGGTVCAATFLCRKFCFFVPHPQSRRNKTTNQKCEGKETLCVCVCVHFLGGVGKCSLQA